MISYRSNPPAHGHPFYCLQRHKCLADSEDLCELRCWDDEGWRLRALDVGKASFVTVKDGGCVLAYMKRRR